MLYPHNHFRHPQIPRYSCFKRTSTAGRSCLARGRAPRRRRQTQPCRNTSQRTARHTHDGTVHLSPDLRATARRRRRYLLVRRGGTERPPVSFSGNGFVARPCCVGRRQNWSAPPTVSDASCNGSLFRLQCVRDPVRGGTVCRRCMHGRIRIFQGQPTRIQLGSPATTIPTPTWSRRRTRHHCR